MTRTVWAGDQLAYEIRARWSDPNSDGFADAHHGRVGYLHAGTIDRPIALWKGTQLVHPHLNSRGVFPFGTCGTAVCSTSAVEFIGNRLSAFGADRNPPPFGPTTWHGSLIRGQLDASGLLFRRNRYADPLTGTFTQPDPIGVVGGLNVFAYAGGDPISYSQRMSPAGRGRGRT